MQRNTRKKNGSMSTDITMSMSTSMNMGTATSMSIATAMSTGIITITAMSMGKGKTGRSC